MGYYTDFTVKVVEGYIDDSVLSDLLSEVSGYEWGGELYLAEAKWYDHEKDLLKLSRMRPDITLQVLGEGENRGDIWCEYYRNGKFQRQTPPEIVIPPLDENGWM